MIQMSQKTLLIGAQSILNVFLAGWLYVEYIHNKFMQDYLTSTFSSMSLAITIGLMAAVAVVAGSVIVYSRRHHITDDHSSLPVKTGAMSGSKDKIAVLDTCPFCNVPLRSISESRFQCRKCRRYFKK